MISDFIKFVGEKGQRELFDTKEPTELRLEKGLENKKKNYFFLTWILTADITAMSNILSIR